MNRTDIAWDTASAAATVVSGFLAAPSLLLALYLLLRDRRKDERSMAERFVIQPFFEDLVASADERLVVKVWDMSDSPIFSPMLHVLVLITPKAFVRSSDDLLLPGDSAEINLPAPSIPPQDGLSWLKGNRRWSITDARARRLGQPIRQVPPAPERRWRRRRPLNQQLSFHPLLASIQVRAGKVPRGCRMSADARSAD
jgi:hypothetical protein